MSDGTAVALICTSLTVILFFTSFVAFRAYNNSIRAIDLIHRLDARLAQHFENVGYPRDKPEGGSDAQGQ